MKKTFVLPWAILLFSSASTSFAMSLSQVDSCLESDISRLETSKNFKDFVAHSQLVGTDLKALIESFETDLKTNTGKNSEQEEAVRLFIKKAKEAILTAKTCDDISSNAKKVFQFDLEYQKTTQEIVNTFQENKTEMLNDLRSVGLTKAAETLTTQELFILSTLQSDLLIYSFTNPANLIRKMLVSDFTDLTTGLNLVLEDYENKVAELRKSQVNADILARKAQELALEKDRLVAKIEKEMTTRASTYSAKEIDALLLQKGIQQKIQNWKSEQ